MSIEDMIFVRLNKKAILQLTTIKTAPDTPTEVDSVDTQVNSNGGSAVTISDCISSKNWCNFEFKCEITGHYCKLWCIFTKSGFC